MGNVVIEDNVEIGANTTIDRATMGSTRIHKGVKLDNLIMLAHNTEVGENTAMAAQTGVSGSTHIGKNCVIAGQCGFVGHIKVADGTQIGAQSGILGNIRKAEALMGSPTQPLREYLKSMAYIRRLDEMSKTIDDLKKQVETLKGKE